MIVLSNLKVTKGYSIKKTKQINKQTIWVDKQRNHGFFA